MNSQDILDSRMQFACCLCLSSKSAPGIKWRYIDTNTQIRWPCPAAHEFGQRWSTWWAWFANGWPVWQLLWCTRSMLLSLWRAWAVLQTAALAMTALTGAWWVKLAPDHPVEKKHGVKKGQDRCLLPAFVYIAVWADLAETVIQFKWNVQTVGCCCSSNQPQLV